METTGHYREIGTVPAFFVSVLLWACAVLFTIFFDLLGIFAGIPLSVLTNEKTGLWQHRISQLWGKSILAVAVVWRLTVTGKENLPAGEKFIIVANHQSMSDILVVLAGLPLHFKFMAKAELFPIPFIGWQMRLAKYIPLLRGSKDSAVKAVGRARELLRLGPSILLFPEGTRSFDGELLPFKAGAFRIAAEEGVRILPVVIDGTGHAIPKHEWLLRRLINLRLHILKPVTPSGTDVRSIDRTMNETRELMAAELRRLRAADVEDLIR